jgi:hypothetical protein
MVYYVEGSGVCCLEVARHPRTALNVIKAEFGNHFGPYKVRKATQEDIDWVRGMGGSVPKEAS